jgi:hypothetical protein
LGMTDPRSMLQGYLIGQSINADDWCYSGWNYWPGNSANAQKIVDVAGVTYVRPLKTTDFIVGSKTLATCINYDSTSGGKDWGAIMPHLNNGSGRYFAMGVTPMVPTGIAVAKLDGSAGWVKWTELTLLKNSSGSWERYDSR